MKEDNSKSQKCSSKGHDKIKAINYCQECRVYLCNKCEKIHSELYNHDLYNITDKDIKDIFTGICHEENHEDKLDFFCKTHNKLVCAACISKMKIKGNGQHTDCDICIIEDIHEQKKSILNKNIKYLEDLSINLEKSINELKKIFEKINVNKDNIKIEIQKIFTKIRNGLNDREDELLKEVDEKYDELFFKEDLIKESEKLPKKIKTSIEKGKSINNNWNNDKLNSSINDCVNIENNIEQINTINNNVKRCNLIVNLKINFYPNEDKEINESLEKIKRYGNIYYNNFRFKKYEDDIKKDDEYEISGEIGNILTKTGIDKKWLNILCENKLEKDMEYTWKIKILKSQYNHIMVGIAPHLENKEISPNIIDKLQLPDYNNENNDNNNDNEELNDDIENEDLNFIDDENIQDMEFNEDQNLENQEINNKDVDNKYINHGWYFNCYDSTIYFDFPYEYKGKETKLKKVKDEIYIIMEMKQRNLKFKIDKDDQGEIYKDIPIDKSLVPAILLYDKDDSIEITLINAKKA